MPTFFIISGFLVSNSEKRKGARASFSQVIRVMKLYLVWSVIYLPLWIVDNRSELSFSLVGEYLQRFLFDGSYWHLWYLPSLIFAIIIFYGMQKLFKGNKVAIITVALVCYIIGLIGDSYSGIFEKIPVIESCLTAYRSIFITTRNGLFYGLFFYTVGYYLETIDKNISRRSSCLGIAVGILITVIENTVTLHFGASSRQNMYIGTAVIALCSVLLFKEINISISQKSDWFIRRMSTIIYMVHIGIFRCVMIITDILNLPKSLNVFFDWVFVTICSIVICKLIEIPRLKKLGILC